MFSPSASPRVGLAALVAQYHRRQDEGAALWRALFGCVRVHGQRFPPAYFELAQRDEDSLRSLTNRLFYSASHVPRGVQPYRGRVPFGCYTEDLYDDRQVRYHAVFSGRSLTRQIMRGDYRKNRVRIPEVGRRFALYEALGGVLPQVAVRVPGFPERWEVPVRGPGLALSDEALVRRLREAPMLALAPLVSLALSLARHPMTRSALTHLLADVLPPTPADVPAVADAHTALRLRVRTAVARAWAGLDPNARRLCALVAQGLDAREIGSVEVAFRDPAALSRALASVSERFLSAVASEVVSSERESGAACGPTPRARMELILGVLLEMLPELDGLPESDREIP